MKEFFARLALESPEFFKKVMTFGKWVVGVGAVLIAAKVGAPEQISPKLLDSLVTIGAHMVFGGGLIVGVAALSVNDTDELKKKLDK